MTKPNRRAGRPPRPEDFERDLEPGLEGEERDELLTFAARLTDSRPVPSPGFRSAMRSMLLGGASLAPRSRVALLIFGYASSGALLLAVAAVGLVGIGPFAA
jgi:hypothetical protein